VNKRAQVFLFARIFYNITFTYKLFFLTQYDDFLNIDISQGSIATFYMFIFWRMVRWCQVKSSIIISAVVFKKERICSTSGTVLS